MKNYNFEEEKILKQLDEKLSLIIAKIKMNTASNPDCIFFDNAEFIQVMNISKRTAVQWRADNTINYSMVGAKIYYTLADILSLINKTKKIKPYVYTPRYI